VIVTCPSCSSKYRVRDEAVPPEGAELQCPSCNSIFMAHPLKTEVDGANVALEKMTRARDAAELRVLELENELSAAKAAIDSKDIDVSRARADAARADARIAAADASVRRLSDEIARSRAAGDAAELLAVKQQLFETQRRQKSISADLDVANTLVASLQTEMTALRSSRSSTGGPGADATRQIAALQTELEALRTQTAKTSSSSSSSSSSSQTQSMIAAIGPMLWGLDNSITYLEQFAGNEKTLAGHVRQLRLLQKVLQRLADQT